MKNYVKSDSEVMYHVGLSREMLQGAHIAVLPGDPGRVLPLAKELGGKDVPVLAVHREYTSALIEVNGQKVLVCSTGMGGPSTAICLEELARLGIDEVIRFGTTGTIQEHVDLGDVLIAKAAVRLDGTSRHYAPIEFPAVADFDLTYLLADNAKKLGADYHLGIAVSSDTFWPGQERYDSFTGYVPRSLKGTMKEWQQLGAVNYEMETSALFVVSQALGIQSCAILGVVAKRTDSESIAPSSAYDKAFAGMVQITRGALGDLTK